ANLLVASFKKKLLLIDPKGAVIWQKDVPHFPMAAAATEHGARLAVALFDGRVMLFDAEGNETLTARLPFAATLTGVGFSADGKSLYLGAGEGDVIAWNLP